MYQAAREGDNSDLSDIVPCRVELHCTRSSAQFWELGPRCRIASIHAVSSFSCTTDDPSLTTSAPIPFAPGMPRLSGLQKDVLSLYRRSLRACRVKPADTRPNFEAFTRREFEKNLTLDKKDFSTIEFMLRKGNRQLDIYASPGVTNIAG